MAGAAFYGAGTIFDEEPTDFNVIFDFNLSYRKASWVVHMLRGIFGDGPFFAGLGSYLDTFAHNTAITEQFHDVMEEGSGLELEDFFLRWIYGERYPKYLISWNSTDIGGANQVTVRLEKTQDEPLFNSPVEFEIQTCAGSELFTLQNDRRAHFFNNVTSHEVTDVQLDPEDWILSWNTSIGTSGISNPEAMRPRLLGNSPNPFNPSTIIGFELPDETLVKVAVYDLAGRLSRTLEDELRQAGSPSVRWDGRSERGQVAAWVFFLSDSKLGPPLRSERSPWFNRF